MIYLYNGERMFRLDNINLHVYRRGTSGKLRWEDLGVYSDREIRNMKEDFINLSKRTAQRFIRRLKG